MPSRPPKRCQHPACPTLTQRGNYCDQHRRATDQRAQRQYDRQRGNSAQRGYGASWKRLRLRILQRDLFACQECKRAGRITLVGTSGHVDHIIPREQGGGDEESNLQTLCAPCHSRKTATEDHGFGNQSARGP